MDTKRGYCNDICLPFEILDKILQNVFQLENKKGLEELKKCRLISPKFYEVVEDLFQNKFRNKFQTHFDGLKESTSYLEAKEFGQNIYNEFKFNFTSLKISHSEVHLLKTWIGNFILANLQTLILTDNTLNWKELIQVLKNFKSIVNLKFVQTSRRCEQLHFLFHKDLNSEVSAEDEVIEMIKNEVRRYGNENFLPNLKSLEMCVIHPKIMNFLSIIVGQAVNCKLEDLKFTIDYHGLFKSLELYREPRNQRVNQLYRTRQDNDANEMTFKVLKYLGVFSKSMKNLEIIFQKPQTWIKDEKLTKLKAKLSFYVINMFSNVGGYNSAPNLYKGFEKIIIDLGGFSFVIGDGFSNFIKNQENLQKLQISTISDNFYFSSNGINNLTFENFKENIKNFLQGLVKPNCETTFDYLISECGFEPILNLSNNLTSLQINLNGCLMRFSDDRIPVYPNCSKLVITITKKNTLNVQDQWPDFDLNGIVRKFQNLEKLVIGNATRVDFQILKISNEDVQTIIRNYKNLKELALFYCCSTVDDSGLTGLTRAALELRKNYSDLPIQTDEKSGLPISHLKKLENFAIAKRSHDQGQITDMSLQFGLEKMVNLKIISLRNTKVTSDRVKILQEKIKPEEHLDIV